MGRHLTGEVDRRWPRVAVLAVAVVVAVVVLTVDFRRAPRAATPIGAPSTAVSASPARPSPAPTSPAPPGPAPPGPAPSSPGPASSAPSPTGSPGITYEAEAPGNVVAGSANIAAYPGASGGRLVKTLGLFGTPRGAGSLRFTQVVVPVAGSYRLTVYYVHPDNEPHRTLVVTVGRAAPVSVLLTGSAVCCRSRTILVVLNAGANTITLGNPQGHAPAIDRIAISA